MSHRSQPARRKAPSQPASGERGMLICRPDPELSSLAHKETQTRLSTDSALRTCRRPSSSCACAVTPSWHAFRAGTVQGLASPGSRMLVGQGPCCPISLKGKQAPGAGSAGTEMDTVRATLPPTWPPYSVHLAPSAEGKSGPTRTCQQGVARWHSS